MKKIKKAFSVLVALMAVIFFSASPYTCASVPKLPEDTLKTIEKVMDEPLPELVKGETGFAVSGNWKVWYERISPNGSPKGTILLVMGAANDALAWPQRFISAFTDAGYQVVRYDHRGTGLTVKLKGKKSYTLKDMALDPVAILDSLNIQKAHFVGASMGGMVSQLVAINHPERTASLTSIMSSANLFDTVLPTPSPKILPKMISAVIKHGIFSGKKGKVKLQLVHKKILMGEATGDISIRPIAQSALYTIEKHNGYHFSAGRLHQKAIEGAESRYNALSKIKIPVLVVHGKQDPVIPIAHGKKMAGIIPNSDSLWLDNMGHDLPDALIDSLCGRIMENFSRRTSVN